MLAGVEWCLDVQQKAQEQTLTALQINKDIVGIFGLNVFSAQGSTQAVINAGLSGAVKMCLWDATLDNIANLKKGNADLVLAQKPGEMGPLGIEWGVKYLKDKKNVKVPKKVIPGFMFFTAAERQRRDHAAVHLPVRSKRLGDSRPAPMQPGPGDPSTTGEQPWTAKSPRRMGRAFWARSAGQALATNWAACFLVLMLIVFSLTGRNFLSIVNFQNVVHLQTVPFLLAAAEPSSSSRAASTSRWASLWVSPRWAPRSSCSSSSRGNARGLDDRLAVAVVLAGLGPARARERHRHHEVQGPALHSDDGHVGNRERPRPQDQPGLSDDWASRRPALRSATATSFTSIREISSPSSRSRPTSPTIAVRELLRLVPFSLPFILIVLAVLSFLAPPRPLRPPYLRDRRQHGRVDPLGHRGRRAISSRSTSSPPSWRGWPASSTFSRPGSGNYTTFNAQYEFFAVAAVVVGGASLMGGKGRIWNSAMGVLVLAFLENGLAISGVQPFYRYIAVGVLLVVAVVIDKLFPDAR